MKEAVVRWINFEDTFVAVRSQCRVGDMTMMLLLLLLLMMMRIRMVSMVLVMPQSTQLTPGQLITTILPRPLAFPYKAPSCSTSEYMSLNIPHNIPSYSISYSPPR